MALGLLELAADCTMPIITIDALIEYRQKDESAARRVLEAVAR